MTSVGLSWAERKGAAETLARPRAERDISTAVAKSKAEAENINAERLVEQNIDALRASQEQVEI